VARSSKRANRTAASVVLFLLAAGSVIVAATKVSQDEFLTGAQFVAWACLPLAVLLGFTLPVRCRVRTTRGTACGNAAYGLLFGCSNAAGHRWGKFRARLGIGKDISELAPIGRQTAVMYQPAPGPQTIRLTIEDSALTKCGSWATLISTVATVIALIITIAAH
jgi:hypothetical protein